MWSVTFDNLSANSDLESLTKNDKSPEIIMIFGDTDELCDSKIPLSLKNQFPNCKIVGCSTGTNINNEKLQNNGISGTAIGFDSSKVEIASQEVTNSANSFEIGANLGAKLKKDDLVGVFILSDGLNVNGSDIVGGILSVLGGRVKVSGGLAGDGPRFGKTIIIDDGIAKENCVLAIGFYGKKLCFSHGSEGGWQEQGDSFEITKSSGNIMFELNGQNAYETYAKILGDKAKELPVSGLLFPLKIWHPNYPQHDIVRTLLAVDKENGSLTFAGDMPVGWRAQSMIGTNENLILGSKQAALKSIAKFTSEFENIKPNLCLFVSCVGRRLLMGDEAQKELNEVIESLPNGTNISGFYSYGEIAPHRLTNLCSLHNQTLTLTLIGEAE